MAAADEEAWVDELFPPEPGSFLAPGWRDWLHDVFEARGRVELDEVESMARSTIEERAGAACLLVTADAVATLGESVTVSTVTDEWDVRVVVDGQVVSGVPLQSIGEVELIVEVADAAPQVSTRLTTQATIGEARRG